MTNRQIPMNRYPSTTDSVDELVDQMEGLRHRTDRVMDTPISGHCGQQLTVTEAQDGTSLLGDAIDAGEAGGSQRLRRWLP